MIESIWDVLSSASVFLIGAMMTFALAGTFGLNKARALTLYLWHTSWCLIYLYSSLSSSADSIDYFLSSSRPVDLSVGSNFVILLTSILNQDFGLSYLGCFLVFNIFGVLGLLAFDASLHVASKGRSAFVKQLSSLIVFLPSISYWSSAIGKDSIAFMAVGLSIWASFYLKKRIYLMGFAIMAMALVRPHLGVLIFIVLWIVFLLGKLRSKGKLLYIVLISIPIVYVPLQFVVAYIGLGINDFGDIYQYVIDRASYNIDGEGGIDISEMTFVEKLLSYLFRPLFVDASNILQFASSVDNFMLILFCVCVLRECFYSAGYRRIQNGFFLIAYPAVGLIIMSLTTANLGIAARQKWMFLPMLIVYLVAAINTPHTLIRSSSLFRPKPTDAKNVQ